jgi:hypothetical protein
MVDRVRRGRGVRRASPPEGVTRSPHPPAAAGGRTESSPDCWTSGAVGAHGRSILLLLEASLVGGGGAGWMSPATAGWNAGVAAARAVEGDLSDPWSGVPLARGGLLDVAGGAGAPAARPRSPKSCRNGRTAPGVHSAAAAPLGRALLEAVRAAAAEHPIVLAVDDAQWLDPDSALSLGVLLRDLKSAPLTLVLASSPYPERPELDELRSRIGRDLEGGAVRLRRLDRAALRSLAGEMLPGYDTVSLDRVVRRVATDPPAPLLAVELLRAVALSLGTIAGAWPRRPNARSTAWRPPDAVVAPSDGVPAAESEAQRVLVSAAVLGDLAAPAVLARALEMGDETLAPALDELEWHRWLVSEPRGYSFSARIVRQVVQRDMVTPGQRRRVLEAAAEGDRALGGR